MADRNKEYIGSPLSDQHYKEDEPVDPNTNQEGNKQSGLTGEREPGQPEVEGDTGVKQPEGPHGDKSQRRGNPTL